MTLSQEKLSLGRRAEDIVQAKLLEAGLYVECRRDASGPRGDFSPRVHSSGKHIPVPDFRTSGAGLTAHVEVKGKQWISWWEIGDRLEHGIDLRAWDHYRHTQEQTGQAVLLVVVELESPHDPPSRRHIRIRRTDSLGSWLDDLLIRPNGRMGYFPRDGLSTEWISLLKAHKRVQLGFLLPEAYA